MGFSRELINMAWEESNTESEVINTLLVLADKNNTMSNTPTVNYVWIYFLEARWGNIIKLSINRLL